MSAISGAASGTGVHSVREQGRTFVQSTPQRDRNTSDELQAIPMASQQVNSKFVSHGTPDPNTNRGRILDIYA